MPRGARAAAAAPDPQAAYLKRQKGAFSGRVGEKIELFIDSETQDANDINISPFTDNGILAWKLTSVGVNFLHFNYYNGLLLLNLV